MIPRNEILKRLRAQIHVNGHILGTVAGPGMTARYSAMGGRILFQTVIQVSRKTKRNPETSSVRK